MSELLVGFNKTTSGKGGLTYPQALDQALCFGWIDGVRRSLGAESYTIRFTPRRPTGSYWSAVNIAKVRKLQERGLMKPAGTAAFEQRDEEKANRYSYERKNAKLDPAVEKALRANAKAWAFFDAQAPWYKRTVSFWVTSAKKEETRQKRLAQLIELSAAGKMPGPMKPAEKRKPPAAAKNASAK